MLSLVPSPKFQAHLVTVLPNVFELSLKVNGLVEQPSVFTPKFATGVLNT